jgi:polysaccharide biosynthesis/export protein
MDLDISRTTVAALVLLVSSFAATADSSVPAPAAGYRLQPGDVLLVSVWREPDLTSEVLVRPDGALSFPLAGELTAAGRTVEQLRAELEQRVRKYVPEAVVTVGVKALLGNRVYVIGKVARPGDVPLLRPTDVMQVLALAGGTTPFADVNDIKILRRENGRQTVIEFRFGDVERGRNLEQNVVLQGGDTVVVP